jgi:hypothetical protein
LATLVVSPVSADDVSSVYLPVEGPLRWSGPAIGIVDVGYFFTFQYGPVSYYTLGGNVVSLGGIATSDVDASNGSEFLVARGEDGAVWYNRRGAAAYLSYSGWKSLGGEASSGPSVASWNGTGRTFVVARGMDNALWVNEITAQGPTGWSSVGGSLSSDPDASIGPDGLLYITARGDDAAVWINAFNGAAWGGWVSLGGLTSSGPSIAYNGTEAYVLTSGLTVLPEGFTRSGPDGIWANHLTAAGWGGWFMPCCPTGHAGLQPDGGQGGYAIDAFMSSDSNTVYFVTVGTDGNIWDGEFNATTGPSFRRIG